jgi:predicted transcriptional regulator
MATKPYTFEIDERLMQQFVELAQARGISAEEILPYVIRDFIAAEGDSGHNAWLREQVQIGIDQVEAGNYIPGEEVEAEFAALRAETQRRLHGKSK